MSNSIVSKPAYSKLSSNVFGTYQFLLNFYQCYSEKDSRYFSKLLFLKKSFWLRFYLLSALQLPCSLFFVLDGVQYNTSSNNWVVQYNCSSMSTDERVSTFTFVPYQQFFVSSVSSLFSSTTWLERELSDFSGLNFLGLSDTRRLLLDYFDVRCSWQTHIGNDKNYNNNLYDIFLNF